MQRSSHHMEYAGKSQGRNGTHKLQWRQEMQACINGKQIMARVYGSRQGGYLAYSLQRLVIYICTALETEASQMVKLNQLPQAFAGHLQRYYS